MNHGSDGQSPREDAPADAALERALDALGQSLRDGMHEALPEEAFDDRDYHALAHGFHAARRDMLDAERDTAPLHRFPRELSTAQPSTAQPSTAPARPFASPRWTLWGGLAAIAAGLALLAWSAFGSDPRQRAGASDGVDPYELGNLRGGDETLSLRCEREGDLLQCSWSGKRIDAAARLTLRIYPAGSLRAALVRNGIAGERTAIELEDLAAGDYEVEVELATATGVAPASPRVAFRR